MFRRGFRAARDEGQRQEKKTGEPDHLLTSLQARGHDCQHGASTTRSPPKSRGLFWKLLQNQEDPPKTFDSKPAPSSVKPYLFLNGLSAPHRHKTNRISKLDSPRLFGGLRLRRAWIMQIAKPRQLLRAQCSRRVDACRSPRGEVRSSQSGKPDRCVVQAENLDFSPLVDANANEPTGTVLVHTGWPAAGLLGEYCRKIANLDLPLEAQDRQSKGGQP